MVLQRFKDLYTGYHNKYEIEAMKKYMPKMWETSIKDFFDLRDKK